MIFQNCAVLVSYHCYQISSPNISQKIFWWQNLNLHSLSLSLSLSLCHFLCSLQMRAISWSVTLHQAGKACQEETLNLIGPICNLWKKWNAFKMVCVSWRWFARTVLFWHCITNIAYHLISSQNISRKIFWHQNLNLHSLPLYPLSLFNWSWYLLPAFPTHWCNLLLCHGSSTAPQHLLENIFVDWHLVD